MQNRTKQLWIPGFLTLILSMVFVPIFHSFGFQPRLIGSGSGAVFFYVPWLASLPFLGALGAYASTRAGGSRGVVLLVSLFPVLALTMAFLLMFPIGMIIGLVIGSQGDFSKVAATLLKDGVGWLLLPGAALFAGGLLIQFLSDRRSSSRETAIG